MWTSTDEYAEWYYVSLPNKQNETVYIDQVRENSGEFETQNQNILEG
jgi:hypothetical protein